MVSVTRNPRVPKSPNPPIPKSGSQIADFFGKYLCPVTLLSSGGLYYYGEFSKFLSTFYPDKTMKHYLKDVHPGFYSDIGRNARDLLFEDFPVCNKISLSKDLFSLRLIHLNDVLSASSNDICVGEGDVQWIFKSVANNLTVRTNSTFAFKSIVNQVAFGLLPGLSFVSEFDTANANSGKLEVQLNQDYVSCKASIGGLFHDTNVGFSSVIGTKNFSLGVDLLFQTNNLNVTRFDAAFAYTTEEKRTTSIALNGVGQVLVGSYHQVVDTDTSIAAQMSYPFLNRHPVLTIGVEHRLDSHLWLKARADSTGKLNTIIQWHSLKVLGEVRPAHMPRIGLGIALSF
ncbi:Mitochondrial outer membrane protein porin 1 [Raphanus sativus]|uniref:Mitochondrial outer membrane protein porin 1 n=1 Tax=Raphanus sativus TaxID=3726 RepID=A0A6J0LD88_RAPSA|nr:mitochondrial outer membrane protein porin 1 [Raphanus sativus]KAJ4874364.1 Mitochondrial outer membrane protein porin 1 [Raphanus sativus]